MAEKPVPFQTMAVIKTIMLSTGEYGGQILFLVFPLLSITFHVGTDSGPVPSEIAVIQCECSFVLSAQ
jgi:hypothetical protein